MQEYPYDRGQRSLVIRVVCVQLQKGLIRKSALVFNGPTWDESESAENPDCDRYVMIEAIHLLDQARREQRHIAIFQYFLKDLIVVSVCNIHRYTLDPVVVSDVGKQIE